MTLRTMLMTAAQAELGELFVNDAAKDLAARIVDRQLKAITADVVVAPKVKAAAPKPTKTRKPRRPVRKPTANGHDASGTEGAVQTPTNPLDLS